MKKRFHIISLAVHFLLFAFCLCAVMIVCIFFFHSRQLKIAYTQVVSDESAAFVSNPYCGFYQMSGYTLSEDATAESAATWGTQCCKADSHGLLLLEINLKNYADRSLSQNALLQLDSILTSCATEKKPVILRFLYDWDGNALSCEPSDFSRIKSHMKQLSATVNAHADIVYLLQGVFTGNNGEMHGTRYGSADQVRQLMEQLDQIIDRGIFLSVRTPAHLRSILRNKSPLTADLAGGNTLNARLGLYNDGMLGSVYDLGTYDDTPLKDPSDFEEKGTREEELDFQSALCQYVPNGGEVTVDNPYNDLDNAVRDLRKMHVSYLNIAHDAAVINKWKGTVYKGDDIFSNCTGFDYINAHLGYRYVLKESSVEFHQLDNANAKLYLTIENTGFAPAYRQFDVTLTATRENDQKVFTIDQTIDNRKIGGTDTVTFQTDLDVRSMGKGTYSISLQMTDPSTGQTIHFANSGSEDKDLLSLGTLEIKMPQ